MKRLLLIVLVVLTLTISPTLAGYTIGSTYYGNGTQFTVTSSSTVGAVENYQIALNLSNTTGASGPTLIYTNGTTLPSWNDITFTDSSDTELSWWLENSTTTSSSAIAWVNIPSITPSGTEVRIYYGNATKSTTSSNGYTTFPSFDDFIGSTLNTTHWTAVGSPTLAYYTANGTMRITAPGSSDYYIYQKETNFTANRSLVMRISSAHNSGITYIENAGTRRDDTTTAWQWASFAYEGTSASANRYRNRDTAGSSNTTPISGWTTTSYHKVEQKRGVPRLSGQLTVVTL